MLANLSLPARCPFIILLAISSLLPAKAALSQSQALAFDVYSMEQGLSAFPVTNILQDQSGFLWVATVDGLNRYDGQQFSVYKHDLADSTSLPNNYINTGGLVEDAAGMLWLATRGGLVRFNPHTEVFKAYTVADSLGLQSDRINALALGSDGAIWMATNDGLHRFDPIAEVFSVWNHVPDEAGSLDAAHVLSLVQANDSTLWIGTVGGLNVLHLPSNVVERIPLPMGNLPVWSIMADDDGKVWAGTIEGLVFRYSPQTATFDVYPLFELLRDKAEGGFIMALYEDADGTIWAGTWNGGLFLYNPATENWTPFANEAASTHPLPSEQISAFLRDRTGKMWVGTWNGLAATRSVKAFHHLDLSGLATVSAMDVAVSEERIWVATMDGVLTIDRESGVVGEHYRKEMPAGRALSANEATSAILDSVGRLWIGTSSGGVNRVDLSTGRVTVYHSRSAERWINSSVIYKLFEDSQGRIWVGTAQGGLSLYDPENDRFIPFLYDPEDATSLGSVEVVTIFEDHAGTIWIGTMGGGLNKLNAHPDGRFTFDRFVANPDEATAISSNNVVSITEGQPGTLWIGTMGGGLNKFEVAAGVFRVLSEKEDLPHPNVMCVQVDYSGQLWLGTSDGLVQAGPDMQVRHVYTTADGLASPVFYMDGCTQGEAGHMYFASSGGVTTFHPDEILHNRYAAPPVLTAIELFGRPLQADSAAAFKRHLTVPYDQNFLAFSVASLDYNIPEKQRFQFELQGVDPLWTVASSESKINYPNLQPGSYTLRAKAANNDGLWSGVRDVLTITVEPPYWKTWWFATLIGLALVGIVALVMAYRRRVKRELEQTRQQIADDLHDDIGSKLSALRLFMTRFKRRQELSEKDRERFSDYADTIARMLSDLRDVVWLVDPDAENLGALAKRVERSAEKLALGTSFAFQQDSLPADRVLKPHVRRHLFLLIKEAVHNAVRHANPKEITVSMAYRDDKLWVRIQDDGKGFDNNTTSPGQGLKAARRRAEALEGNLSIVSTPGGGTQVDIHAEI